MPEARRTRIDALREKGILVSARFEEHGFKDSGSHLMPYRMFSPANVEPGNQYPHPRRQTDRGEWACSEQALLDCVFAQHR